MVVSSGLEEGPDTMRRFFPPLAVLPMVLLVGCGGGAVSGGAQPTNAPTTGGGATEGPESTVASETVEPSTASTTTLPAACAKGLGEYLVAIEPVVSTFNPAKDTLGDLYSADERAGEKAYDLLSANNGQAPYSCSEVGLEWAYFDPRTPWEAVLAVAGDTAPGTVEYLKALRTSKALDEAKLADYGIDGCDAAVSSIKKTVKGAPKDVAAVDEMDFAEGIDLVGRYNAYMHEVQDEVCPRDQLGNKEFEFMGPAQ